MKKYFAILTIFVALGMGNAGAQEQQYPNQPSNNPSSNPYPAQYPQQPSYGAPQYPEAAQQYPSGAPPSGSQPYPGAQNPSGQYPNAQYPYPSGPAPAQPPDQGGPEQNGAQPSPQASAQSEYNQPGAARVSFLRGDASTQRGDNGQWVALTLNTPIVADDRVATGSDARTEIQLDFADVLRLSSNATANIAGLTRSNIQVQIGQGVVDFAVLRAGGAAAEVDTPNSSVYPNGVGDYRVTVNSAGETLVTVRSGSAQVFTPQGSTQVSAGQLITIEGTDNPQYRADAAPARDEWDTWNADRDHTILGASSWKNTNPYYVGSQDLDQHGTWSEIPDYGQVWTPDQGPDWAPYQDGSWVYEPYYGWTWVSYEPWGWAPYHYGRWFVYGRSWVWWPGPVAAYPGYYPIWAPAYVSFFGFGGGGFGVGFGFGFGRFGWLPVGPGDWYHPWFGGWGARYGVGAVANFHGGFAPLGVGRQNFSTVGEAVRNDRVRGGFSSMAGNEFGRGAVAAHQERISAADFGHASMMTGRMPVTPTRASYSATDRAPGAGAIRAGTAGSQHFFSASRDGPAGAGYAHGSNGAGNGGYSANRSQSFEGARGGSATAPNGGGWQHFTPNASGGSHVYEAQGNQRYGTEGPSPAARANASRPALNMRQPIVTQRGGGNEARPAYNNGGAARGNYSAPRPSYSAPSSAHGGGGQSSHGGGSSHGSGGGHSGSHH